MLIALALIDERSLLAIPISVFEIEIFSPTTLLFSPTLIALSPTPSILICFKIIFTFILKWIHY